MERDPVTQDFEAMQAAPVESHQAAADWANPAVQDYQEGAVTEAVLNNPSTEGKGIMTQVGELIDEHRYVAAGLGGFAIVGAYAGINKVGSAARADGNVPAAHVRQAPDSYLASLQETAQETGVVKIPASVAAKAEKAPEAFDATASATNTTRPDAATLQYVDKKKLPIARQVIKTFRRTKPSQRDVTRRTGQLIGMSHRNVTNISGEIPAKLTFKHGRRGAYHFEADFKGSIKPKNLVSVSIDTFSDVNHNKSVYGFLLGRTKNDGPTNSWPMHWLAIAIYGRNPRDARYEYDSCVTGGGPGGTKPVLSVSGLNAGMRQAQKVLKQAAQHRPIQRQKDVFVGQVAPNLQNCKPKGIL